MKKIIKNSLNAAQKNKLNIDRTNINLNSQNSNQINKNYLESVKNKILNIIENKTIISSDLLSSEPKKTTQFQIHKNIKYSVKKCMRLLSSFNDIHIEDAIELAKKDLSKSAINVLTMLKWIKSRSIIKYKQPVEAIQIKTAMASPKKFFKKPVWRGRGRVDMHKAKKVSQIRLEFNFKSERERLEIELTGKFPKILSNHIRFNLVKMNAPFELVQSMNGILTINGRKLNAKHWDELVTKNIEQIRKSENREISVEKSKSMLIDDMIKNQRKVWSKYYRLLEDYKIQLRKKEYKKKIMIN